MIQGFRPDYWAFLKDIETQDVVVNRGLVDRKPTGSADPQMNSLLRFAGNTGRISLSLGGHTLGLLGLLGRLLLKALGLLAARFRFPGRELVRQVERMGIGSSGVIVLAASTVGISLVFLSVDQLKSQGGLPLLGFFFAKGLLREICPVIAGVVMAVRIGSRISGFASRREGNNTVRYRVAGGRTHKRRGQVSDRNGHERSGCLREEACARIEGESPPYGAETDGFRADRSA